MDKLLTEYNFHDSKLHAMSFVAEAESFTSEIHLDIDYIVQWPSCKNENVGKEEFIVSKAELIFFGVSNSTIDINCLSSGKSIQPPELYINQIVIEKINNSERHVCKILINDGKSFICFDALSSEFHLIGRCISTNKQYLTKKERM